MTDLPVCTKCGWYAGAYASHSCHPDRGAAADALAAKVALPSTKLGWGHGKLTFEFHEQLHLSLRVGDKGFSIDDFHPLGSFSEADIIELITALRSTRIGRDIHADMLYQRPEASKASNEPEESE